METHIATGTPRKLIGPLIISLAVVLPFLILELVNHQSSHDGFPVALFGLLWVLTYSFILILIPTVYSLRAGNRNLTNRIALLSKVVLLTVIAWIWVVLVIDQMPCFLGVPNCD